MYYNLENKCEKIGSVLFRGNSEGPMYNAQYVLLVFLPLFHTNTISSRPEVWN